MQLFARDDLQARIDGTMNLGPGSSGPLLRGELTVSALQAAIPDPAPPDLVTVDVIDPEKGTTIKARNAPGAEVPAAPTAPPPPSADETLALDVAITIPGPAKVTGRGLDSMWRGNLRVTGDATDPRLSGKLTLMRGGWSFGARTLTLTEGTISFDGGPSIQPQLDITATQEDDDFVASLHLTGRAASPKITASSVPAAPQDEVFAHILFGRSVTNLSPLEGLQLANSIAEISGLSGGGPGVLGSIKDRFGLDVLTVDMGEDGGASVKAGSYLTERVYFELKQSGDSAGTRGRVELQIDDNISVETEVGADSSSSVGARYKYDY
jgi:translocation and assembly module TamB